MIEDLHSQHNPEGEIVIDKAKSPSQAKTLARVYGFMGAGLLITALVALIISAIISLFIKDSHSQMVAYIAVMVISIIGMFGFSFGLGRAMQGSRAQAIVSFFAYSTFVGGLCSSLLLTGISFYTLAIAFGITSLIYFVLFVLGYFLKLRLDVLTSVLLGGLVSFAFIGLFWWIIYLVSPTAFYLSNLLLSYLIMTIILVSTLRDASRLRHELDQGYDNRYQNFDVMHASIMYSNFINIFIWVVRIVASMSRR